jgi:hypothetical protein
MGKADVSTRMLRNIDTVATVLFPGRGFAISPRVLREVLL